MLAPLIAETPARFWFERLYLHRSALVVGGTLKHPSLRCLVKECLSLTSTFFSARPVSLASRDKGSLVHWLRAFGGLKNDVALVGDAGEIGGLFQGAMVSIIILIPDKAPSISPCTREISEFRNVCRFWSSDVSPCSPSIEAELNRAMEDSIRSTLFSI